MIKIKTNATTCEVTLEYNDIIGGIAEVCAVIDEIYNAFYEHNKAHAELRKNLADMGFEANDIDDIVAIANQAVKRIAKACKDKDDK